MNKFQRWLRYYKLRFLRLKGNPKSIARGAALGTFIGITPTLPLHTIANLVFAPLLRANLIATFLAGITVCNPLTYIPQYYLSWLIGTTVTSYDLSWSRVKEVLDIVLSGSGYQVTFSALTALGIDTAIVMLLGGVILATPFTVAAYILTFRFFTKIHRRRGPSSLPFS